AVGVTLTEGAAVADESRDAFEAARPVDVQRDADEVDPPEWQVEAGQRPDAAERPDGRPGAEAAAGRPEGGGLRLQRPGGPGGGGVEGGAEARVLLRGEARRAGEEDADAAEQPAVLEQWDAAGQRGDAARLGVRQPPGDEAVRLRRGQSLRERDARRDELVRH